MNKKVFYFLVAFYAIINCTVGFLIELRAVQRYIPPQLRNGSNTGALAPRTRPKTPPPVTTPVAAGPKGPRNPAPGASSAAASSPAAASSAAAAASAHSIGKSSKSEPAHAFPNWSCNAPGQLTQASIQECLSTFLSTESLHASLIRWLRGKEHISAAPCDKSALSSMKKSFFSPGVDFNTARVTGCGLQRGGREESGGVRLPPAFSCTIQGLQGCRISSSPAQVIQTTQAKAILSSEVGKLISLYPN